MYICPDCYIHLYVMILLSVDVSIQFEIVPLCNNKILLD